MIKSLRESKAKLSELVERASKGEEVLITVRGKVKARLVGVHEAAGASEMARWARELESLQSESSRQDATLSIEQILAEDREDRA